MPGSRPWSNSAEAKTALEQLRARAEQTERLANQRGDELAKTYQAIQKDREQSQQIEEVNKRLRETITEVRHNAQDLEKTRDVLQKQVKEKVAALEKANQELSRRQAAASEIERLQREAAEAGQAAGTAGAAQAALEAAAKARAEELEKANEALRREITEVKTAAETREAELNLLASSGKDFLAALEKYKSAGGADREAKEGWLRRLSPFKRESPKNP
jgi:chromosome segregation ATPase